MRLSAFFVSIRGKLLLVALLLLLIPFIGFRFVQQMEQLLLEGQQQVLVSAAKLLSATLSDRPQLFSAQGLSADAERLKLLALFSSADPETAAQLGGAYVPSDEIEKMLGVVAKPATRIWVVDAHARVRGLAGNLHASDEKKATPGLFQQLYTMAIRPVVRLLASDPATAISEDPADATRAVMSQVERALLGQPNAVSRPSGDGRASVMSAAQPVWQGDVIIGAVVVEEANRGAQSITLAALESLLAMTLVVIIVGFGALLIFAWRLAFRVRRLQHEAETAIDQQGRIRGSISGSSAGDEIGALSLSLEAILQRLSQYNHYLEQMAGRLSHELRTPVAVVRSSLDNLRSTAISTEGAVYVARADEGVQRLSSLIARMSEASRLESMLVGADRERCDMVRLIAGCVEGYELAYPASRFLFVPPPKPVAMNVIADAIAQMLDKLVQNAVDFARADSTIKVVLEKSADGVCIRVENKGQPLAEAAASTLFTSMVSSRGEGADTGSHLGLGLYIVRVIAEHHDGHASARNLDDGSGVRFEVLLSA